MEPTREELMAKIAQLEAIQAMKPKAARALVAAANKAAKQAAKERKARFKLEAWKRAHLHWTSCRYSRSY
jgi:hypothetical protein